MLLQLPDHAALLGYSVVGKASNQSPGASERLFLQLKTLAKIVSIAIVCWALKIFDNQTRDDACQELGCEHRLCNLKLK